MPPSPRSGKTAGVTTPLDAVAGLRMREVVLRFVDRSASIQEGLLVLGEFVVPNPSLCELNGVLD